MPSIFESAFTHAAIGMALVAPDGRFLRVNASLCQFLGYTENQLLARTFQDFTHADDLDADLHCVGQLLLGERETYQMEKRYLREDGRVVWGHLSVSLVRDEDGHPLYFISQIQDITARKVAEVQLLADARENRRLYDELQKATAEIRSLQEGLITVCAWTKQVRDGKHWESFESFLSRRLRLRISHGMSDEVAGRVFDEPRPSDAA